MNVIVQIGHWKMMLNSVMNYRPEVQSESCARRAVICTIDGVDAQPDDLLR